MDAGIRLYWAHDKVIFLYDNLILFGNVARYDEGAIDVMDDGSLKVERRTTLRQQATDVLRKAIVGQRFRPGQHLVERELCELLGVSRTSVREALRHLESEGLIDMVPHKGPVVATLSSKEARNIYQVRAALEGLAGELFATNATDAQIKELRKIADTVGKVAKARDFERVLEIKSTFYEVILSGAGNDTLAQMIHSLNTRVWILRRMSLMSPNRNIDMMEEVEDILAAVEARNPVRTREACIRHVENASKLVLPQLQAAERASA